MNFDGNFGFLQFASVEVPLLSWFYASYGPNFLDQNLCLTTCKKCFLGKECNFLCKETRLWNLKPLIWRRGLQSCLLTGATNLWLTLYLQDFTLRTNLIHFTPTQFYDRIDELQKVIVRLSIYCSIETTHRSISQSAAVISRLSSSAESTFELRMWITINLALVKIRLPI